MPHTKFIKAHYCIIEYPIIITHAKLTNNGREYAINQDIEIFSEIILVLMLSAKFFILSSVDSSLIHAAL